MKFKTSLLIVTALIGGPSFTNCISSPKDMDSQEFKSIISVPDQETAFAKERTYSDFQKFIKEAYLKIGQNEANILQMKNKISAVKNESCKIELEMLDSIERSNATFKLELDDYVQKGSGDWQLFKTDFCTGLNNLDTAFNSGGN